MNIVHEGASTIGILVLEDDPVHRLLLEHEFQGSSYIVRSAGDAQGALNLIRAAGARYQIGIFDLKVPSEAGNFPKTDAAIDVIEVARSIFPEMTIITISSIFIGEELRTRLDGIGASYNLSKPFPLEKLHRLVDSCVE